MRSLERFSLLWRRALALRTRSPKGLRHHYRHVKNVLAVVFSAVALACALGAVLSAGQGVDSSTLPPGEERETLFRVCSDCHGVESVTAERRTQAEWRNVVDDMAARGAEATDDEIKTLVHYLSLHVGRVNVNRASAEDLEGVLDLSKEQAEAILAFRTRQGNFHTIDDLKKVPGIDAETIDERKDRIVFSGQ